MTIDSIRASVLAVCVPMLVAGAGCKKEGGDAAALNDAGAGAVAAADNGAKGATPPAAEGVAGDGFEGVIEVAMKSAQKATPDSFFFETKGKKTRMDLPKGQSPAGSGYMLFDANEKKAYIVVDEKKMVMVMDPSKLPTPKAPAPGETPKITKTGKMETIAGYTCENWDIERAGRKSTACMSKGIPFFMFDMRTKGTALSWLDDLLDQKAFPLRMVERDATGAETSRFEATKIEKRAVDDSRFALPAGYTTMDMSAMMQGLQGMGAPGSRGMPGQPPGMKLPPSAQPVR